MVSAGFKSRAITTSCGFCHSSRDGSSNTLAYSSEDGGWSWWGTCPSVTATKNAAARNNLMVLICSFTGKTRVTPGGPEYSSRGLLHHPQHDKEEQHHQHADSKPHKQDRKSTRLNSS